jgi:hypothetical protein
VQRLIARLFFLIKTSKTKNEEGRTMNNKNINVKNNNVSEDFDPHAKLLKKILTVQLSDGFRFSAKLISVNGQLLYFQSKDGRIYVDHLKDIVSMREVI